ncbi:4-hydroxy-3-methylbut-2-enyl diphosphate reductase [Sphingomonas cavernae]|nr:4-hydroxy-3-methylbut-2-enyl diphosphate reductase [Sphingomonas cavernae]
MASPRGFCAGVTRAIQGVVDALRHYGPPVYVRRPIVHNRSVVRMLEQQGAIFVEELDQVPEGAVVILSAHGVPQDVTAEMKRRDLRGFDAICPLVQKVHSGVARHHRAGRHIVLIGHGDHPEIVGTLGQLPHGAMSLVQSVDDVLALALHQRTPIAYAIQTTFSLDEARAIVDVIKACFSDVIGPNSSDICYATSNRQAAVKAIALRSDSVIVAGERFSSNALRLAEVARAAGCLRVQLIPDASHIDWSLIMGARTVGLSAAASTPEWSVTTIVDAMRARFEVSIEEFFDADETAVFRPLSIN